MLEAIKLALKDWDIRDMNDAALFFIMVAKSNGLSIDEDSVWISIDGRWFKAKIVKNLLFGKIYYGPFQVMSNPIYNVEVWIFDGGRVLHSLSYRTYKRSKLLDAYKTSYDLTPEEGERMLFNTWSSLIKRIKIRWSLRRFIDNLALWIVKRRLYRGVISNQLCGC